MVQQLNLISMELLTKTVRALTEGTVVQMVLEDKAIPVVEHAEAVD